MAQTVQILRTTTNNPPPTLLPGALSVELGTQTKLWVGAAGGNRLLMSSDPNDIALSSSCVVSATPPSNPIPGLLWWDSTGGQLYVRYQDANSTAWIAAASATGSFLPISGGTLTGPLILAADPAVPLGAATKQYTDTKLPLAGGTMTGNLTISPASGPAGLVLNKVPGEEAILYGMRNGVTRWRVNVADGASETGSNAGSNFDIQRHNDAGTFIDTPLSINRATGNINTTGVYQVNGRNITPGSIQLIQGTPGGVSASLGTSGGMAGTGAYVVPASTTRVLVMFSTSVSTNTAGVSGKIQLRQGTGTPPTSGAALTGTLVCNQQYTVQPANTQRAYTLAYVAYGLTIGTQYWFDLAVQDLSAGNAVVFQWQVTFLEV